MKLPRYDQLLYIPYGLELPINDEIYEFPNPNEGVVECKKYEHWPNRKLTVTIERTLDMASKKDKYFLRLVDLNSRIKNKRIYGYMYFDVDLEQKKSNFYGVLVRNMQRGNGFSNFLIAEWVRICYANRIWNLYTETRQRKPILLYSLKKIDFDVQDKHLYDAGHSIVICRQNNNNRKSLFFEDRNDEAEFIRSTINKETPHIIIPQIDRKKVTPITPVLLNEPMWVQDINKCLDQACGNIEIFRENVGKKR